MNNIHDFNKNDHSFSYNLCIKLIIGPHALLCDDYNLAVRQRQPVEKIVILNIRRRMSQSLKKLQLKSNQLVTMAG